MSDAINAISRSIFGALLCLGLGGTGLANQAAPAENLQFPACLDAPQFDRQIRSQTDQPVDDRLLIVGITEADIRALNQWPLSDQTYADLLAALQRHQPAVIGLSLYIDVPVPPGESALSQQLQRSNVILGHRLRADYSGYEIPPRAEIPADRSGFLNVVIDPDRVVRRHLLFVHNQADVVLASFSWQLATHYLSQQNVFPQPEGPDTDVLKLGQSLLLPLQQDCSKTARKLIGYQIPLYYRTRGAIARQVTFTQVLNSAIDPAWVQGKIVLVGITAPTFKDFVETPYLDSPDSKSRLQLTGIALQAQMVSQLLTAALGNPDGTK